MHARSLHARKWTPEAEARLLKLNPKIRTQQEWTLIAEDFPGHSWNAVKEKYERLKRKTEEGPDTKPDQKHQDQCTPSIEVKKRKNNLLSSVQVTTEVNN